MRSPSRPYECDAEGKCVTPTVRLLGGADEHIISGPMMYLKYHAECCPKEIGGEDCSTCMIEQE